MESSILKFVLKHSKKEQILLVLCTVAAFPLLYYSLELPKIIINEAIGGTDFPKTVLGREFDQIPYLLLLCAIFLGLVLLNGAFKYVINVYRGIVGERMLRRLRYILFQRVLRFPLSQFRKLSQGELVSMIVSETEPLGGYIGDSIALPVFQGGTLLTILIFMFLQDPMLGGAAIALYPLQGYLIPKLQRKVNLLKKERVVKARQLAESIGEVVSSVREVHAHDTSQYELSRYSEKIGTIFQIRYQIYKQKFLIKFLNNFIAQVTPFFFYSLGGYMVIKGELSFGALVAVLAAYKDLSAPWKELLNYYQIKEDARIKYELLLDIFQPPGVLDERVLSEEPQRSAPLLGEMIASNVNLNEDGDEEFDTGVTMRLELPKHVAIVGPSGSGKYRLAEVLAAIKRTASGRLTLDGIDLLSAPHSITGRRIAFAGPDTSLRAGSLRDNLLYSLKHRPMKEAQYSALVRQARDKELREAHLAGNSPYDINADWLDYDGAGVSSLEELLARALEVLKLVALDQDVYKLGLNGTVNPDTSPELAGRVLEARTELAQRLAEPEYEPLVEPFDRSQYNTNMSVAENLLFGTPRDEAFSLSRLPDNPIVARVLDEAGLTETLVEIGRAVAELMVELFADVAPDSELFEQFSFISADDLPEFRSMLARTEEIEHAAIDMADRRKLLSLSFRLSVARHRLGLITPQLQERLLEARLALASALDDGAPPVEPFERSKFSASTSIQDNILFGRLAYGKAQSVRLVGRLIDDVVEKLNLRDTIMEIGLDHPVGVAGTRLNAAQRQKLAIARCVLKRPDLMVVADATAVLDHGSQVRVMDSIMAELRGRAVIWILQRAELAKKFDHVVVMDNGKLVEQGRFDDLNVPGGLLHGLAQDA